MENERKNLIQWRKSRHTYVYSCAGGGGGVISRKFLRIGEFACTYLALTLLNLNFPYISETYSFND